MEVFVKLRILALGSGSGDVGRDVVRILLQNKEHIERITVTSRNIETARGFVNELGDDRVVPLRLDVTKREQLIDAMREHNLVVNMIGPFKRYTIPIIKAAIETKVNYMDICDDIEPTVKGLQLNQSARDAGIFVLLSMGWFPGMSNLRAVDLAKQMDSVEELVLAWVAGRKAAEEKPSSGVAGIEHYLQAISRDIYSFRKGQRTRIPANQKGVQLSFPEPLGQYMCYQMEHPETATLPYVIPGVRTASVLGSLYPQGRNRFLRFFARAIDFKLLSVSLATRIIALQGQSEGKRTIPMLNGSYVACIGTKGGEKGQLSYSAVNTNVTTAEATSQPLACAILHYASGGKIKTGIHLPETAIRIEDIIKIGKQCKLPFVMDAKERTEWSGKVVSLEKM